MTTVVDPIIEHYKLVFNGK